MIEYKFKVAYARDPSVVKEIDAVLDGKRKSRKQHHEEFTIRGSHLWTALARLGYKLAGAYRNTTDDSSLIRSIRVVSVHKLPRKICWYCGKKNNFYSGYSEEIIRKICGAWACRQAFLKSQEATVRIDPREEREER